MKAKKQAMRSWDKVVDTCFKRYDSNGTGILETPEDMRMLTINICFSIRPSPQLSVVDEKMGSTDFHDGHKWDIERYRAWFQEELVPLIVSPNRQNDSKPLLPPATARPVQSDSLSGYSSARSSISDGGRCSPSARSSPPERDPPDLDPPSLDDESDSDDLSGFDLDIKVDRPSKKWGPHHIEVIRGYCRGWMVRVALMSHVTFMETMYDLLLGGLRLASRHPEGVGRGSPNPTTPKLTPVLSSQHRRKMGAGAPQNMKQALNRVVPWSTVQQSLWHIAKKNYRDMGTKSASATNYWSGWVCDQEYGQGIIAQVLNNGRIVVEFDSGDIVSYHAQPELIVTRALIRPLSLLQPVQPTGAGDIWTSIQKHITSVIYQSSGKDFVSTSDAMAAEGLQPSFQTVLSQAVNINSLQSAYWFMLISEILIFAIVNEHTGRLARDIANSCRKQLRIVPNEEGLTPLHMAVRFDNQPVIRDVVANLSSGSILPGCERLLSCIDPKDWRSYAFADHGTGKEYCGSMEDLAFLSDGTMDHLHTVPDLLVKLATQHPDLYMHLMSSKALIVADECVAASWHKRVAGNLRLQIRSGNFPVKGSQNASPVDLWVRFSDVPGGDTILGDADGCDKSVVPCVVGVPGVAGRYFPQRIAYSIMHVLVNCEDPALFDDIMIKLCCVLNGERTA